jgi:hypothetical protein
MSWQKQVLHHWIEPRLDCIWSFFAHRSFSVQRSALPTYNIQYVTASVSAVNPSVRNNAPQVQGASTIYFSALTGVLPKMAWNPCFKVYLSWKYYVHCSASHLLYILFWMGTEVVASHTLTCLPALSLLQVLYRSSWSPAWIRGYVTCLRWTS